MVEKTETVASASGALEHACGAVRFPKVVGEFGFAFIGESCYEIVRLASCWEFKRTGPGGVVEKTYYVHFFQTPSGPWATCSCPDFTYRGQVARSPCKHANLLLRELARVTTESK